MKASSVKSARLNQAACQLLLLASREQLENGQRLRLEQLAHEVDDWKTLCGVSRRSLGLSLVYQSLSTLPVGAVPAEVLQVLHDASRLAMMRTLQIEATLLEFHSMCLGEANGRHVFFKGPALAHRFYQVPAHRPCRDLDVLIPRESTLDVMRRAYAMGYRPSGVEIGETDQDLAAWVKYGTVYPMRAPNGVLVEIHRSLDHDAGMLDSKRMLDRAETFRFRGQDIRVLRTADLFVYICMHHTRHFWSHLHWYADVDAIVKHPLLDLSEVEDEARRARLSTTVSACLDLSKLAGTGDWLTDASGCPGLALLTRSVECLLGGHEREAELRASRLSSDRAFAWQLSWTEQWLYRVRKFGRKCKPSLTDYRAMPLPSWLQPVYYFTRPVRAAVSRLARFGAKSRTDGAPQDAAGG